MLNQSQLSTCTSMTDPVQEMVNLLKDISLSLRKTRKSAESIFEVVKAQFPIISSSLQEVEEKINGSINVIAPKQPSNRSNSIVQSNSHRSAREQRMDQSKEEFEQVGCSRGLAHYRQVSNLSLQQEKPKKEAQRPYTQHEYQSQQALSGEKEEAGRAKRQESPSLSLNFGYQLSEIVNHFEHIHEHIGEDEETLRDIHKLHSRFILLMRSFDKWPSNETETIQIITFFKEQAQKILSICKLSRYEKIWLESISNRVHLLIARFNVKAVQKRTQSIKEARQKLREK